MNTETKLSVPTIVCGGCATGIKKALDRVSGISSVDVDIDSKVVTVKHDETVFPEKLAEVLDDAGFPTE
jgi:copper chaperone CopZ